RSTVVNNDWNFQNQAGATFSVNNARVQDSTAANSITATNSTDLGGTTNWFGLTAADLVWLGTADTNWNNPANFDLGILPIAGSDVTFRNATTNVPTNLNSATLDRIVVESSFNPTGAAA